MGSSRLTWPQIGFFHYNNEKVPKLQLQKYIIFYGNKNTLKQKYIFFQYLRGVRRKRNLEKINAKLYHPDSRIKNYFSSYPT